MKKLFKVKVYSNYNIKNFYVVAEDEGYASKLVQQKLKEYDYSYKYIESVSLVAEQYQYTDIAYLLIKGD